MNAQTNVVNATDVAIPTDQRISNEVWRVFVFVFLGWALVNFSNVYTLASPFMIEELHFEIGMIGIIASVYSAGGFISSLWLPLLADKKGRRLGMSLSILAAALFNGGLGLINSIFQVFGLRFIAAHGQTCQWGIGASYLSEMVPAKNRGAFLGAMQSGTPVGTFLCSGVFALVSSWGWGWREFCYVGLFGLILIPFVMGMLKESPQWIKYREDVQKGLIDPTQKKISLSELFKVKYRKNTLIAMSLHIVGAFWAWGNMTWFLVAMRTDFHFDAVTCGKMNMLLWGTAIIGYPIMGKISDIIGRKKGMLLASSLTVISCISLYIASKGNAAAASQGSMLLYIATIMLGFGMGQHSILIAYSSEIFPSHIRAVGTSVSIGAGRASAVFTMLLLGYIAQNSSATTAELVAAFGGWLMVPIVWIFGKETARKNLDDIID
ncbi:MAG: transporter [Anaerosporomusa subterranea]|jgi:MFS family permease|nr:transporter [Anaerosporomusa subterranea]